MTTHSNIAISLFIAFAMLISGFTFGYLFAINKQPQTTFGYIEPLQAGSEPDPVINSDSRGNVILHILDGGKIFCSPFGISNITELPEAEGFDGRIIPKRTKVDIKSSTYLVTESADEIFSMITNPIPYDQNQLKPEYVLSN